MSTSLSSRDAYAMRRSRDRGIFLLKRGWHLDPPIRTIPTPIATALLTDR